MALKFVCLVLALTVCNGYPYYRDGNQGGFRQGGEGTRHQGYNPNQINPGGIGNNQGGPGSFGIGPMGIPGQSGPMGIPGQFGPMGGPGQIGTGQSGSFGQGGFPGQGGRGGYKDHGY